MDEHGNVVLKKRFSRTQLLTFLVNVPACLIGMEASCGCHHLGRQLQEQGHDIRLIPAQFVKPFVKSQKNDYADAQAIAEAVQRPTMRFVPIKTEDQLDVQAMHRVRERLLEQRTSLVNQLRAFLLERGLVVRTGRAYLWRVLSEVMTEAERITSPRMFRLITCVAQQWRSLEAQIEEIDIDIAAIANSDEACVRLQSVPGIGPLASTAMISSRKGIDVSKRPAVLRMAGPGSATMFHRRQDETARNQ